MTPTISAPTTATHPRLLAFLDPRAPDVFSGTVHPNQIWEPDPFDVEEIHLPARECFNSLLHRAQTVQPNQAGKILLLLGDAGCGKTHLMRAFRNETHSKSLGYCGYLQMTIQSDDYARYILSYLIDSLEHPYVAKQPGVGLNRLANGLLDALTMIPQQDRDKLHDDLIMAEEVPPIVERFADFAVQDPRFEKIDLDLIRGVLYLIPKDARIRMRILKWLRCEDLADGDRKMLGGLVPRARPEMPMRTIVGLGKLMHAVDQSAMVLLIDQLEEMIDETGEDKDRKQSFRRLVNDLVNISENVPNAIVVVACLEDFFGKVSYQVEKPKLDRLKNDPPPVDLNSHRTDAEIQELVARRLERLFDEFDIAPDNSNRLSPYTESQLKTLSGQRTRDVLFRLQEHHKRCIASQVWEPVGPPPPPPPLPPLFAEKWQLFLSQFKAAILDDEEELATLLAKTIARCSDEMANGVFFVGDAESNYIPLVTQHANDVRKAYVGVCDGATRGGGLANQFRELAKRAGEIPTVLVRSTDFPKNKQAATELMLAMIAPNGKGRRAVVQNSEWRTMAAFQEFHKLHSKTPNFGDWQKTEKILTKLDSIRKILDLDNVEKLDNVVAPPEVPPVKPPFSKPASDPLKRIPVKFPDPPTNPVNVVKPKTTTVLLGKTRGITSASVTLERDSFCTHMAFLGAPGSGKTTAALNVMEQLLLQGIPCVLIDRKGDLARYADPKVWDEVPSDPERKERHRQLRDGIDVALFTPGNTNGRPLTLPLIPAATEGLSTQDRQEMSQQAGDALASMMGFRPRTDDNKRAILTKAIEIYSRLPGTKINLTNLKNLIAGRDDDLVNVASFDERHYRKLEEDLLTLILGKGKILEGEGEALNVDALLGRGEFAKPGKTRMAIVNTQFLKEATDFWLTQFLLGFDQWRRKNPSPNLQAILFFDEADLYLPAVRNPPTKAPMEGLLRRARSAGIGIFLATQSPGDLDYRCRDQIKTWLIGRVREKVAIQKVEAVFESSSIDPHAKLPDQGTGEFYLATDKPAFGLKAEPSIVKTTQLGEEEILALAESKK